MTIVTDDSHFPSCADNTLSLSELPLMLVLNMMLVLSDISYKFRDINKILLSIMENLLP